MKTLHEQLEEAEAMLDSVRKQLEAKEDTSWPEYNDKYWFIYADGKAAIESWRSSPVDNNRLSIGNVYRTKEEAEKEVTRRKVMKKLKDLAGGFVPDWSDAKQYKYSIQCDNDINKFLIWNNKYMQIVGAVYFPTKEAAQHAIDVLGDELGVLL